ncbi:unnamed protein product [Cylindrotheca closterium]|uniref:Uncharacterized protein n=1 Tax=Cylindrotheca closterium TaxID=2856 RepID=A0AAD2CJX4_9STRA|nr:unnamed protein product [Cylindrotheca closterium]
MRVSLAALAVLTNALPTVTGNNDKLVSDWGLLSNSNIPVRRQLETLRIPPRFGEAWSKALGNHKSRVLKNNANRTESVECDPTAGVDADIGILACGSTDQYYCMESKESKLGGICVDAGPMTARNLFAGGYYVDAATYYCTTSGSWTQDLNCNCSTFDSDSRTGSVKCSLADSYCFQETSCETCVHLSAEFKIASADSYAIDWCYEFFLPYDQNVCVEYAHQPTDASGCSIEFNGVSCDSCNMLYYDYKDPESNQTYQGTCANFNCANTEGNHSGNLCEDLVSIPTILDQTCDDEDGEENGNENSDEDGDIGNSVDPVNDGTNVSAAKVTMPFLSWIMLGTAVTIALAQDLDVSQLFDLAG